MLVNLRKRGTTTCGGCVPRGTHRMSGKTDQEGQGAEIAIPRGYRLRPDEAVQTWLAAEPGLLPSTPTPPASCSGRQRTRRS
jgi:hypothetical protein